MRLEPEDLPKLASSSSLLTAYAGLGGPQPRPEQVLAVAVFRLALLDAAAGDGFARSWVTSPRRVEPARFATVRHRSGDWPITLDVTAT